MDICKSEKEYIEKIAPPVQRCCKRYGYLPSVLIAQSCLENGYGIPSYWDNPQIKALIGVNNMVGIKRELLNKSWVDRGLSVWQGGYISKDTPEQYGGQIVTIKDDFRTYDCIERSFADYLCFMTYASNTVGGEPKYGEKVLTIKDPERLIRLVSVLGYATGQTYPNSVMRIVNKHNLTKYDDLTGVEPTDFVPGGTFINHNWEAAPNHNTSERKGDIKYIVVHYVGGLGGAKANVEYYNSTPEEASADFYVGHDGDIWQYNEDLIGRYCWAVGGGRQTQYGGALFGVAKNANSVNVEMCVRNPKGRKEPANAPSWYVDEKTVRSTVKLVKYLMDLFNVPAGRVIRHYDVNGKLCPGIVGWNDASGDDSAWMAFKAQLGGFMPEPTIPAKTYRVQVGAYKSKSGATRRSNYVREVTQWSSIEAYKKNKQKTQEGYSCFVEPSDGMYKTYCGSYSVRENAEKRSKTLFDKYEIDNFIVEVTL